MDAFVRAWQVCVGNTLCNLLVGHWILGEQEHSLQASVVGHLLLRRVLGSSILILWCLSDYADMRRPKWLK